MQLTPEDKLILASVKIQPTIEELDYLNNLIPQIQNWEYLVQNIVDRGIGPLFLKKLPLLSNSQFVPTDVKTKLQQAYYRTLSRGMVLYDAFKKIAEAFNANGIQVIALKGIYLAENLYKDIALRQFSDIDLLVKEEDGLKCIDILSTMGFKPFQTNMSGFIETHTEIVHYSPMLLNDVSVEIHIKLHRRNDKYKLKVGEFVKNTIPVSINGTSVTTLDINDLIIYLCIHLDKHFVGGRVQFTSFNDIVNILDVYKEEFNWDRFIFRCRENECEELVFGYLMLLNKYYDISIPDYLNENYHHLLTYRNQELFCKYLKGGSLAKYKTSIHIENIRQIMSFKLKLRYYAEVIFPPRKFMIEKYNIQHSSFVLFYYPYRYYIGLKGLVYVLRNSKSKE